MTLAATAAEAAPAGGGSLVFAVPGIPPIFASVVAYVAQKQGFFATYGGNVQVRPFDTGTAAARAVVAGDIDMAMSPSALVINQISNADANVVAIWGMPNPDWILATTDPSETSCKDIVGKPVGVDAIDGARSIALRTMLAGGCPGVKMSDVQQVALSSNTASAMIAGQLKFGVLHLDDVAAIEAQGKKVYTILSMHKTNPNSHYILVIARRDKLAANRQAYVDAVAGLIAAARFIQNPANADTVAQDASPTGHTPAISKEALKEFLKIGFWPVDSDGMDRKKLESVIATMEKVGGIRPGNKPVTYGRLVDPSIWRDANALVKQRGATGGHPPAP